MSLNQLTIKEAQDQLAAKQFSSEELVQSCLAEIVRRDPELHAFHHVFEEDALVQAREIDARRARGEKLGALAGIPIALKDNILYQGRPRNAGSRMLAPYVSAYHATVVEKLLDADAIVFGCTNMDEFAMGSSTEYSAFGPTKNPHDPTRVPGGSSGGSAAAVAAHMCLGALGSDTGGSVREPAAFCGVVGLKPTYGRVSRYGLIAMASSLDQVGPLAKTVEDAEILFNVIAGHDPHDATSIPDFPPLPRGGTQGGSAAEDLKGVRIGVPKEFFREGLDPVVAKRTKEAISELEKLGAEAVEVSLPSLEYALACYYVLMPAEASSNLARFDGMRYGHSAISNIQYPISNLYDAYANSREKGFGAEVKRRILLGSFVLSSGYIDAYYKQGLRVQAKIRAEFEEVFKKVDVIAGPTTPVPAFKLDEKTNDPLTMYLADIFTVPANLAGIPAISIPCGEVEGLPVGLQLMAGHQRDNLLFQVGRTYERNHHKI